MNVHRAKLGTMPAMLQLRYAYRLREGLSVVYREIHLSTYRRPAGRWLPAGPWSTGIVRRLEPMLFVDRY